jgi:hypothetical protein
MKRFLGVLIASMFLASAAYAADDMKDMKEKKADGEAKGEKTKGEKGEKAKGAKGEKTKGEKGEKTKGEKGEKADKPEK